MMDIKINLRKVLFEFCLIMPMLYTMLCCIKTSLANKAVILELIVSYILINKIYIKKNKSKNFILLNFIIMIYVFYTFIIDNLSSIIHLNFYSYLFMFIIFWLFMEKDIREDFLQYFLKKKKMLYMYFVIFILIIMYSVLSLNGIHMEFNSTIPILYGPFEIPHILAYILLIYYCTFSVYENYLKNKINVFIKGICVIGIIFTGVRSAALALIILMCFKFISVRNTNKKLILILFGIIMFLYLLINTSILKNNPIINKTIASANAGSITNGREIFREIAIDHYFSNTTIIEKIFGAGMPSLINAIYEEIHAKIHAHNDYVNLLVGYGGLGLILIIYSQFCLNKICKNIVTKIFLQSFIFILCYFNGFAMYIMLTASFPIILCFFEIEEKKLIKININEQIKN